MSEYITEYDQEGNPAESFIPGDDKQRIDLTEFYQDTGQEHITNMVQGAEAFGLGLVSRRVASLLCIQGCESFDPFPSERNARMGVEGFFTSMVEGFKGIIEAIIKYVRMAINWVMDMLKTLFGFRKTERVTKAINEKRGDLKKEFEKTLSGLGFPASEYNLENFIGDLPKGEDRKVQLTLLRSKLVSDVDAIKGLEKALPRFQQCVAKLVQGSNNVTKASQDLKKVIDEEHKKAQVRYHTTGFKLNEPVPESNRVFKACMDTSLALDISEIVKEVNGLLTELYGTKFTNEELTSGFDKVRTQLQADIQTKAVILNKQNIREITSNIQQLNARYVTIQDDEIDLRKVDWRALGNLISVDEMTKVKFIADQSGAATLLTVYQKAAVDVRDFTGFCFLVTQQLNIVEHQIVNLVGWYDKATAYYSAMVLNDIETMQKMIAESKARGTVIPSDRHHLPKIVAITEADAQTFLEKFSVGSQITLDHDIAGLKTNLDAFTKQIGWKP
jgi:hypothetical protein